MPTRSRSEGGWHATDSIDYIIVVSGEIWCELEEGEVHLRPGDVLIQTGTNHAWHNHGTEPALVYAVAVGAPRAAG